MLIKESIQKNKNSEVILKSIIWNSIIRFSDESLKINIKPYLKSIHIKGKTILIKTNKPIVNNQMYDKSDEIKKYLEEKMKNTGIKFNDFEVKYI